MPKKPDKSIRAQVEEFLPNAVERAICSYNVFTKKEVSKDEKGDAFTIRHSAAKVAAAHLELLLKLAKWSGIEVEDNKGKNGLSETKELLKFAAAEVASYKKSIVKSEENEREDKV